MTKLDPRQLAAAGATSGQALVFDGTRWAPSTPLDAEQVRDIIGAALVAGSNVTLTVNDAGDTITISASGGGGGGGGAPQVAAVNLTAPATMTIPDSTITPVAWSGEEFDSDGFWDSAQPTRLTIPDTGFYIVYAELAFPTASTAGDRQIGFLVNGVFKRWGIAGPGGLHRPGASSGVLSLTAGQYVEVAAYQNTGSSRNLIASADATWATIHRVAGV